MGAHSRLAIDAVAVSFYRLGRDEQPTPNFRSAHAHDERRQKLAFPRREAPLPRHDGAALIERPGEIDGRGAGALLPFCSRRGYAVAAKRPVADKVGEKE